MQYLAGLDEQVLQQFGGSSRGYDVREDQKQLSQVRSNVRISLVILTLFSPDGSLLPCARAIRSCCRCVRSSIGI